MSDNYKFYAEKMEEIRVCREINQPLQGQLLELFTLVRECETYWESRNTNARDA